MTSKYSAFAAIALILGCNSKPLEAKDKSGEPVTHVVSESTTISDLKKIQIINKVKMGDNSIGLEEETILNTMIEQLKSLGVDAELVSGVPASNRVFAIEHSNMPIGSLQACAFKFRLKHLEVLSVERNGKYLECLCETWATAQQGTSANNEIAKFFPASIAVLARNLKRELEAGTAAPKIELKR